MGGQGFYPAPPCSGRARGRDLLDSPPATGTISCPLGIAADHDPVVFPRTTWLQPRAALALALVALVVLCLGLGRALVVCTKPCCGGHVKLTRACEAQSTASAMAKSAEAKSAEDRVEGCACCAAHRDRGEREGEGERHGGGDCGSCVHVALGVELGLPPAPIDVPADGAVFDWLDLPALAPRLVVSRIAAHPPSTGPPRCDRRTALLASTVLRI